MPLNPDDEDASLLGQDAPAATPEQPEAAAAPQPADDNAALNDDDVAMMIRNNAVNAVGTNPQSEAGIQHLARFTGQPVQDVRKNPAPAQQQAAAQQVGAQQLVTDHPAVAKFLAHPDNMKIALDDISNMKDISTAVQPTGIVAGLSSSAEKVYATTKLLGAITEKLPIPQVDDLLKSVGLSDKGAAEMSDEHKAQAISDMQDAIKNTPSDLTGSIAGVVPFILSMPLIGAATQFESNVNELDQGVDPKTAAQTAAIKGSIMQIASIIPMGSLDTTAMMPFLKSLLVTGAKSAAVGATQENLADTASSVLLSHRGYDQQAAAEAFTPEKAADAAEFMSLLHIGGLGLHEAFSMGGGDYTATGRVAEQLQAARDAQASGERLKNLSDLAAASQVRARRVDQFQNFVADAAKDGPVEKLYFDPNSLAQSGIDINKLATMAPSVASQIPEAHVGNDISIPIDEFAAHVAGTPEGDAMLPHARTDPEGLSAAEADTFLQSKSDFIAKEAARWLGSAKDADITKITDPAVTKDIADKISATGYRTPEQAMQDATIRSAFIGKMANYFNMTPADFYEKYGKGEFVSDMLQPESFAQGENGLPGFYSKMQDVLTEKLNGKGTPQQFLDQVKAFVAQGHFKKDELYWSGLEDQLKNVPADTPLTKTQVLQAIKHVQLETHSVDETTAGENDLPTLDDVHRGREGRVAVSDDMLSQEIDHYADNFREENTPEGWLKESDIDPEDEDALDNQSMVERGPEGKLRFNDEAVREHVHDWVRESLEEIADHMKQVMVGDNNFEIRWNNDHGTWSLLDDDGNTIDSGTSTRHDLEDRAMDTFYEHIMDQGLVRHEEDVDGATHWYDYQTPGEKSGYTEMYLTLPSIQDKGVSQHAGAPDNTLMHARFSTRTDSAGKKTLYIDEIQSDWQQQAREKGQVGENEEPEPIDTTGWKSWKFGDESRYSVSDDKGDMVRQNIFATSPAEAISEAARLEADERLEIKQSKQVAKAPFDDVNKYTELMVKRLILHAIETGHDRVAWSPGHVQADRWSGLLQQHIDEVAVHSDGEGSQWVHVRNTGNRDVTDFLNQQLGGKHETSHTDGKTFIKMSDAEVSQVFGDGMGQRIKERAASYRAQDALASTPPNPQTIVGADLKLNDKGMTEYYDKIIRNVASSIVKKFGGKIESTELNKFIPLYPHEQDPYGTSREGLKVQSFDINDKMKQSLGEKGFPLFQNGQRASFNPHDLTTALFKGNDLSSIIHENGHYFLEMMTRMSAHGDAPPELREQTDKLMQWLGVKGDTADARLANWRGMKIGEQRPMHEQMALSFERYMMSGKAPSQELQPVFRTLKNWMLGVYKSAKDFLTRHPEAGQLNPEIRQVFDRMLASEEQIKEAEHARNFVPLFKSAEEGGFSPDAWADYLNESAAGSGAAEDDFSARSVRDMKWLSGARDKLIRSMQRDAAAKRSAIRNEVTKDVMSEPVNKVRQFLSKGELKGENIPEGMSHKLGIEYTKEVIAEHPELAGMMDDLENKYGAYGLFGKDGLHPDGLATEYFGYSSGAEMLLDLATAENSKDKISALTDQRMLERHGDLTDPRSIAEAADRAIHNTAHTKFLATEMAHLEKLTKTPRVPLRVIKDFAERMVNGQKVSDLKPNKYALAAARAGREAEVAMKKGDKATAVDQKRKQVINQHATKTAYDTKEFISKSLTYLKKFDRKNVRDKLGTGVEHIDALLDQYDLRKSATENNEINKTSLNTWYNSQREAGYEPQIDESLLTSTQRQHYSDMSVGQFKGLVDAVKSIEHTVKEKNNITVDGKKRRLSDVVDEFLAKFQQRGVKFTPEQLVNPPDAKVDGAIAAGLYKTRIALSAADAALLPQEYRRNRLDVHDIFGPAGRYIFDRIFDRNYWKVDQLKGVNDQFRAAMTELGKDWQKSLTQLVTNNTLEEPLLTKEGEPPVYMKITRAKMIGIARHVGNESNFAKLYKGMGWKPEDVWKFLHDNMSEKDWQAVKAEWDSFDSLKGETEKMVRRTGGVVPTWIEPRAFQTKFGVMDGGYAPIDYDPINSKLATKFGEFLTNPAESIGKQLRNYKATTTFNSSLNNRQEGYTDRINLDYHYVTRALHETIHDLAYREALLDTSKIVNDRRFKAGFNAAYGPAEYKALISFLDNVRAQMSRDDNMNGFQKWLQYARQGIVMTGVGYRVTTIVKHGSAAGLKSMGYMNGGGNKYLAARVARLATGHLDADIAEAQEKFPEIRARLLRYDRDFREGNVTMYKPESWHAKNDRFGHAVIAWADTLSAVPLAHAAYDWAVTDGIPEKLGGDGQPMTHDEAVRYANKVVREAHGSSQETAMSNFMSSNSEAVKMLGTIYGFQNNTYGQLRDISDKAVTTRGNKPELFGKALAVLVAPAVMAALLSPSGDDKHDNLVWWMGKALLGEVASTLPLVRNAWQAIEYRDAGTVPALKILDDVVKTGKDAVSEYQGKKTKILQDAGNAIGETAHISGGGQLGKSLQYMRDVHDGKQQPQNVLDYAKGLTIGAPAKK